MWAGHFKVAVSSLRQSRWRTFFTMAGIIIGICSVVTVVSLGEGLKHRISGQINQLGSRVITVRPGKPINKQGGKTTVNLYSLLTPSTLTNKDVQSVSKLPFVQDTAPIDFVASGANGPKGELDNIFVAGSSASLAGILHQNVEYGSFFSDDDSSPDFAVIGSDIAANLYNQLNPVGQTIRIMGQDFTIQGVLGPSSGGLLSVGQANYNSSVFIPSRAAEQLAGGHYSILQILVQAKTGSNIDTAVSSINQTIAGNHGGTHDFSVLKQDELLKASDQALNTVTGFIAGIAAISLLVGGIGIMNIMLVSVSERNREIGIRKAIGATNRQVLNQFLIEGLALSVGGGIIGIGVSYLINLILRLYSDWQPVISVTVLVLAVGVSVGAGVLFSVAPALKAARKNPIDALRSE